MCAAVAGYHEVEKEPNFLPGIRERRGRGKTIAITIRSVATFSTFREYVLRCCATTHVHLFLVFYVYNLLQVE
jgi:hypothetical protein